ncbi:crAss001_48 related protein [Campylobacter coli]
MAKLNDVIKKLEVERDELSKKIEVAEKTLEENKDMTTAQRVLLAQQVGFMRNYVSTIEARIDDLRKQHTVDEDKSIKEHLEEVAKRLNKDFNVTVEVLSFNDLISKLTEANERECKGCSCCDDNKEVADNSIHITIDSELKNYLDSEFKSIKGYLLNISRRLAAIEKANSVEEVKPETPSTKEETVSVLMPAKPKEKAVKEKSKVETVKEKSKTAKVVKTKKATTVKKQSK